MPVFSTVPGEGGTRRSDLSGGKTAALAGQVGLRVRKREKVNARAASAFRAHVDVLVGHVAPRQCLEIVT